MPSTFGIAPLIPGLANEVAFEILLHFVAADRDGPATLMLVCKAWRDMVLSSKSLQKQRCSSALTGNREKVEEGICIVSFDGGGPGSMSQLRMLDEFMRRLAFEMDVEMDELRPADYFDLMGGVGFGGFVALLLGRLRMTTTQAMEELSMIGSETFPRGDGMTTKEVAMDRLRTAIESMLERLGHSIGMKLRDTSDNRFKVVLFAATTEVMDHCHPFRTYRSPRKGLECTLVDAACATMAISEYFSPVSIGPRLRKQSFAGIPHGFDNPMREVLKEAQLVFGDKNPVLLVLSLGSGQRARLSDHHDHNITRLSRIHSDGVARDLQHQFRGLGEYLRLNVDRGMESIKPDDWHKLGSIETYTNVYLEMNQITKYIDEAIRWLLQRNGSVTLGQFSGTSADCVIKFSSETLEKYLEMGVKQMDSIAQKLGIESITLVDAIGNHIPIPTQFCLTYSMLSDVIGVYFRHQKPPGRDFVQRGDYRLVQGSRKNTVGPMEWARIEKVGLKVEMSMILRTRNEERARCPSCRTWFEGRPIDGWAQCMSCSGQFQIETQVQSDDTTRSEDRHMMEHNVATPVLKESKGSKPLMRERTISGEARTPRFRLFSVINLLEQSSTHILIPQQQPRRPPQQPPPLGGPGMTRTGGPGQKLYQQQQPFMGGMTSGPMGALPPPSGGSPSPNAATPANPPTPGGPGAGRGMTNPTTPANAQPFASTSNPTPGGRPGTASGPPNTVSYTLRMAGAEMAAAGVQSFRGTMQRDPSTNMGLQQPQHRQARQAHSSQTGGPRPQSVGPGGPGGSMGYSSLFRPTPAQMEIDRSMQIYGPSQNQGPMEGIRYGMGPDPGQVAQEQQRRPQMMNLPQPGPLQPQHTGGSIPSQPGPLAPQHTGGIRPLAPQHTGGSMQASAMNGPGGTATVPGRTSVPSTPQMASMSIGGGPDGMMPMGTMPGMPAMQGHPNGNNTGVARFRTQQ